MNNLFTEKVLIEILDYLPRYINHNRGIYTLIIQKNEHEGNSRAYIARYAKENPKSFSTSNVLIRQQGKTINEAVYMLYLEYLVNWDEIIKYREQKSFIES
jgi:hypothetical protein